MFLAGLQALLLLPWSVPRLRGRGVATLETRLAATRRIPQIARRRTEILSRLQRLSHFSLR